jgi:hypothetical protein
MVPLQRCLWLRHQLKPAQEYENDGDGKASISAVAGDVGRLGAATQVSVSRISAAGSPAALLSIFKPGVRYRMPAVFGPAPGPRKRRWNAGKPEETAPCNRIP